MKTNFMNLRIFALIILTGLILSSCSKKDKSSTDNLIGTWTFGTYTYTATVGDMTLAQYFTDVMGLSDIETQQYTALFNVMLQQELSGTIQMKSDGTYISNIGGSPDSGTWILSADGKTLTIDPTTDVPVTIDIIELTSNTLHAQMTQSIVEDLNNDQVDETILVKIDITFSK